MISCVIVAGPRASGEKFQALSLIPNPDPNPRGQHGPLGRAARCAGLPLSLPLLSSPPFSSLFPPLPLFFSGRWRRVVSQNRAVIPGARGETRALCVRPAASSPPLFPTFPSSPSSPSPFFSTLSHLPFYLNISSFSHPSSIISLPFFSFESPRSIFCGFV